MSKIIFEYSDYSNIRWTLYILYNFEDFFPTGPENSHLSSRRVTRYPVGVREKGRIGMNERVTILKYVANKLTDPGWEDMEGSPLAKNTDICAIKWSPEISPSFIPICPSSRTHTG